MMDPVRFSTAFVDATRRRLEPPPAAVTESAAPPQDSVAPSAAPKIDPRVLARQAYVALTTLIPASAGNAPVALAVAAEVGRNLGGAEVRQVRDRVSAQAGPPDPQLQASEAKLREVFEKVARQSTAPAELKLWGRAGEASALGETIFAGQRLTRRTDSEPCLAYIFAHELAHVEHQDSQGLLGVLALGDLVHKDVGEDQWNLMERSYSHSVEFAADRRAAEMVVRLGYDPRPILSMLMHSPHDGDHPAGLKRAQVVREVFAEHGVKISASDWKALKQG